MQVEKDIVVARDFIEGNVYEKTGYRPVKLFSDQSLKSFKKVKLRSKISRILFILSHFHYLKTFQLILNYKLR